MAGRSPLAGEYVLLALLRLRTMHGYEMARYIESEGISEVCPVEQNLLYAYLRNLESRGYVEWQEVRVGLHPPRKQYDLTEAGRALIDGWLRKPVERMRQVKLEFLVKLFFLARLDADAEARLLRQQIDVCESYRRRLLDAQPAGDGFPRLVALSKLAAADATLTWLRAYARELSLAPAREALA
jgi:PadR family transcriptional regulator AphA